MKKVEIGGGGWHRTGLYTYLARTKACMFLGCNVWAASSATYSLLSWYNTLISLLSPPPYFFFPFQKKVSKETSEHWVLHVTFSQALPIFYMLFTHLLTYRLCKSYRSLGYNLPTILKKKKIKKGKIKQKWCQCIAMSKSIKVLFHVGQDDSSHSVFSLWCQGSMIVL